MRTGRLLPYRLCTTPDWTAWAGRRSGVAGSSTPCALSNGHWNATPAPPPRLAACHRMSQVTVVRSDAPWFLDMPHHALCRPVSALTRHSRPSPEWACENSASAATGAASATRNPSRSGRSRPHPCGSGRSSSLKREAWPFRAGRDHPPFRHAAASPVWRGCATPLLVIVSQSNRPQDASTFGQRLNRLLRLIWISHWYDADRSAGGQESQGSKTFWM